MSGVFFVRSGDALGGGFGMGGEKGGGKESREERNCVAQTRDGMRIGLIKRRTKSHRSYNEFAGFFVYRAGRLVCGEEGHQSGYMDRDDFELVRDWAVCAEQAMRGMRCIYWKETI